MIRRFLFVCALFCGAVLSAVPQGPSAAAVGLFGKSEAGAAVSSGYLFVDGLFVPGPYAVSRAGNVILVNGRPVARLHVEHRVTDRDRFDREAAAADPAAQPKGEIVSDRAGASFPGADDSDAPPVLREDRSSASRRPSAIEERLARKRIERDRLAKKTTTAPAARHTRIVEGCDCPICRKLRAQQAGSADGFNREAVPQDPMALFEEADYTYTPPSMPEPEAVTYTRPAARKSLKERMAEIRGTDTKKSADTASLKGAADTLAAGQSAAAKPECFDGLTETEIAEAVKKLESFRASVERVLKAKGLLLLESDRFAAKPVPPSGAVKFFASLGTFFRDETDERFVRYWGRALNPDYLKLIHANRKANAESMQMLLIRAEQAVRKAKAKSR